MTETRLIINADDYGLAPAISQGIRDTIEAGRVTSLSILANFSGLREEVARIKDYEVSRGLHLNLTEGKPLVRQGWPPGFLNAAGSFKSYLHVGRAYLSRKLPLIIIASEFEAQMTRLHECGAKVDHIDSHQNIHLLPPVAKLVVDLATGYDVKWVRVPSEKYFTLHTDFQGFMKKSILWPLCRALQRRLPANNLKAVDNYLGLSGLFSREPVRTWGAFLQSLSHGIHELCVHPGLAMDASQDPIVEFRVRNRAALLSEQFEAHLVSNSVALSRFTR